MNHSIKVYILCSSCSFYQLSLVPLLTFSSTMLHSHFETEYKLLSKLGQGGFGDVYKCSHRSSGKLYAAKIIDNVTRFSYCSKSDKYLPDEILLWRDLYHDTIIQYVDYFCSNGTWIIVMEYLSGYEDLFEYMRRKKRSFDEIRAASIISQVITGVKYLKRKGIDHRDLKLENVLYNNKTKTIKIIDFGCAGRLSSRPYRKLQGTEQYYPPEWFERREFYPVHGIVWSIGIMTYIILNSKSPFPSLSREKYDSKMYKKLKWRNENISSLGKKFIKKCLRCKPQERSSFDDLLEARWLRLSTFV